MTVGELLQRMTSREFSEWMAFYRLEPWGTAIDDWRFGMLAAMIANTNRDPKKQRKPFEAQDFMPVRDADPRHEMQSDDEIAQVLHMWQTVLKHKGEEVAP